MPYEVMWKPLEVPVDRDRWRRGQGLSSLCDTVTHELCVTGFLLLAAGAEEREIMGVGAPRAAFKYTLDPARLHPAARALCREAKDGRGDPVWHHRPEAFRLMELNDAEWIEDEKREERLTELGEKIGVKFVFRDEAPAEVA